MNTALITGGAKRIGAAIARDLARHGYNLVLQYTSSGEEAENLKKELSQNGIQVILKEIDLIRPGSCQSLFETAASQFGPIGLLINNASIFEADDALTFDERQCDNHFAIHLKVPSILSSCMAHQPALSEGLIVNIIDQRVWHLNPNFYSYTASKSALWTITRTLAQRLAPKIRVNAIGPGPTLPNQRQSEADFARQVEGLLLKRSPALSEFGETIRFLQKAKSVTGQMIALDGGQHLAWETPDISGIRE